MAEEKALAFDTGIDKSGLEKGLAEIEESIASTATVSEKKAEAAFENMEKQAKRLAKAYEDTGMDASEAMQKAWKDVQANADAFGTNASENFRNVGAAAEDAGSSVDNLSGKLQNALAAAGLAYGVAEIKEIGTSYEKAMNQVAMSTGTTGQELENLQSIASNVYADNFGESMEAAAASVAEVYKRTGLVGEELQKATEDAYTLQNAFGYEVNDSLQAATQLMNTFGISAEEAYTLIAQGAQKGLDQNGDMLDTLNEYSVQFANLGYSAEDMFNMLANGVQNGTWSVDKLGDAVKEMNIRLNDGTADEALQALGLGFADSATNAAALKQAALDVSKADVELQKAQQNVNDTLAKNGSASTEYQEALNKAEQAQINLEKAQAAYNKTSSETTYNLDEIKGKLAAGGSDAQEAIQEIMMALSQVENEQDRYVLGQTLMGTQWEDIGESAVQALMNTQGEISTTSDAMDDLADNQFNDFDSQFEKLKRQIETDVVVPITQKYMPKIEKAIDYVSEHLDEIVEHAKPIAAGIAAAFAVKKIVDFGTTTVNTVKTIKTAFQILNASNPLGWIALGIGAVVSVGSVLIADAKKKSQEWKDHLEDVRDSAAKIPDEVQKSIEKTQECTQAWEEMHQKISQDGMVEDSDYEAVNRLKDSLMALINADGTIKTGQEEKVQSLIDQLDEYSYTGLTVSDGLIQKNGEVVNSYSKIAGAIDEVIDKQHAQNYLDMLGEASKQAQQERPALLQAVTEQNQELQAKKEERQQIIDEMAQFKLDNTYTLTDINGKTESIWNDTDASKTYDEMREKLNGVNDSIQALSTTYYESTTQLEKGADAMHAYKEAAEAYASGDLDTVTQAFSDLQNNVLTASTATAEQLKAQEEEARTHYETLKQMAEEKPGSVLAEDLNDAKRLAEDAAVELEIKTGEHADNAGKTFLDTLSASGMSEGEKLDALNRYIEERLNNGDNLNKIAQDIGLDYDSGFATGITDNAGMVEEAVKALGKVAEAHLRISIDSHSPSKLSKSIGGDWDEGFAIGIEEGIPDVSTASADMANTAVSSTLDTMNAHGDWDKSFAIGIREGAPGVSAVSANMANAAVSSTLGIMNAQGAAAVSAYSPVLQQAYAAPAAASTSTAAPSSSQPQGDIIIPISIGDETLETVVVNAITRANASSGGWSV